MNARPPRLLLLLRLTRRARDEQRGPPAVVRRVDGGSVERADASGRAQDRTHGGHQPAAARVHQGRLASLLVPLPRVGAGLKQKRQSRDARLASLDAVCVALLDTQRLKHAPKHVEARLVPLVDVWELARLQNAPQTLEILGPGAETDGEHDEHAHLDAGF